MILKYSLDVYNTIEYNHKNGNSNLNIQGTNIFENKATKSNNNYNMSEDEESDQELLQWELNKLKDGIAAYCKTYCLL